MGCCGEEEEKGAVMSPQDQRRLSNNFRLTRTLQIPVKTPVTPPKKSSKNPC